ncbi:MAG: non-canonical purine NTP pyrophosphatase [Candidatus Komeilibacteria bacterium]
MKNIYFITSNKYKFQIAEEGFKGSGFKLIQKNLATPEIQSTDLREIAAYSAQWAANNLKHPVVLTDAGCFIPALKGFPGPFIKYINGYLTAQDYLKLMAGRKNRKIIFKDCLAYCEPGKKPLLFYSSAAGRISTRPGKRGQTSINEIFIPKGFNMVESEIPRQQMVIFWSKNNSTYRSLVKYLSSRI